LTGNRKRRALEMKSNGMVIPDDRYMFSKRYDAGSQEAPLEVDHLGKDAYRSEAMETRRLKGEGSTLGLGEDGYWHVVTLSWT
jgi:hypothetical protein